MYNNADNNSKRKWMNCLFMEMFYFTFTTDLIYNLNFKLENLLFILLLCFWFLFLEISTQSNPNVKNVKDYEREKIKEWPNSSNIHRISDNFLLTKLISCWWLFNHFRSWITCIFMPTISTTIFRMKLKRNTNHETNKINIVISVT